MCGAPGIVEKVEIDTNHFKGNYPDRASLDGQLADGSWVSLLAETKLEPHRRHFFAGEVQKTPPVSHVRLNIFPDGGVSRLRVHGRLAAS